MRWDAREGPGRRQERRPGTNAVWRWLARGCAITGLGALAACGPPAPRAATAWFVLPEGDQSRAIEMRTVQDGEHSTFRLTPVFQQAGEAGELAITGLATGAFMSTDGRFVVADFRATDGPLPGLGPAAVPDEPSVSPGTVPTTYDSPPFVFDLEGGRYARLPGVGVGSIMNYASGDMSWYFIDRSEGRVGLHALGADAVWETDDLGRLLPHHVTDPVAWWFGRGGVALALRADRRRLIRYEYSLTQAPRVTGWADVPPGLELASPAENYFQLGPIWVSEDMRGAVAEADGRLTHFDLSRHITRPVRVPPELTGELGVDTLDAELTGVHLFNDGTFLVRRSDDADPDAPDMLGFWSLSGERVVFEAVPQNLVFSSASTQPRHQGDTLRLFSTDGPLVQVRPDGVAYISAAQIACDDPGPGVISPNGRHAAWSCLSEFSPASPGSVGAAILVRVGPDGLTTSTGTRMEVLSIDDEGRLMMASVRDLDGTGGDISLTRFTLYALDPAQGLRRINDLEPTPLNRGVFGSGPFLSEAR